MGMSVDATLVYGYELGSMEDFKAAERGEYDGPNLPWLGDEDADFAEEAEKVLLASVGFTEEWRAGSDGYFDRKRAAEAQIGVDFEFAGSHDYPGYVLHAKDSKQSVEWSEVLVLDPAELSQARDEWDAKLSAALTALGITPTQTGPKWLVFPFYG